MTGRSPSSGRRSSNKQSPKSRGRGRGKRRKRSSSLKRDVGRGRGKGRGRKTSASKKEEGGSGRRASKNKSAKSAKSKKADKEKLKKEEEERKAREEEEERQRLLEEERERKKREKQEALERARREKELAILKREEFSELKVRLAQITNDLNKYESDLRQAQEWDRYVRCDGTPDPTILGQINTYINLNREAESLVDLDLALEKNHLTLSLIDELFYKIRQNHPKNAKNRQTNDQYNNTIMELQGLTFDNVDNATLATLEKAVYMADKDSGNLQTVSKNEDVTVALWANLAKNAKIRSFMFENEGVGFEIPRTMATSDISIRFVLTKYDFHSYQATSYPPVRRKVKLPELPELPAESGESVTDRQTSLVEDGNEEPNPEDPVMALLGGSPQPPATAEEPEQAGDENADKTADTAIEGADTEKSKTDSNEVTTKKDAVKEEGYEKIIPDPFAGDESVINLHQWAPIYGVLYIDLISVPPQPITANGWIMKQVVDKKLQRIDFKDFLEPEAAPADGLAPEASQAPLSPGGAAGSVAVASELNSNANAGEAQSTAVLDNQSEVTAPGATESAAPLPDATSGTQSGIVSGSKGATLVPAEGSSVKVLFKLPSTVAVPEMEIQVGCWNDEKKCWKIDGISDVTYDKEQNLLSWKTSVFGAFCCFQDSYVNMPLQQWEMKPKDANHILLTIISTVAELELEIKEDKCRLNFHEDREQMIKELKPICGKWVEPLDIIQMLKSVGINIFPESYSQDFVSICEKDPESEKFVYQQMALTASGVSFAWSRFNAEEVLAADQIVIQAHDEFQTLSDSGEEDWCLLMVGKEQMCKLAIDEYAETFAADVAAGEGVHFDMIHLVKPWISEKSLQRIDDSTAPFIDAVYQILSATKLITFS